MKKTILHILLDLVFLAVFNVLFFVVGGTDHIASIWISYGFMHFAYVMVLATALLIRKSKSKAVFGFSLYSISSVYFFLEFIIGLFFIFKINESYKVALSVQVILAGLYAVILLANLIANEHTADSIEKQSAEAHYIKDAASRLKLLVGKSSDKDTNKKLERVYDLMHSSPAQSISSVKELETKILDTVAEIEATVKGDDFAVVSEKIEALTNLIEERNRVLGANN